jgi:hypothetical protein
LRRTFVPLIVGVLVLTLGYGCAVTGQACSVRGMPATITGTGGLTRSRGPRGRTSSSPRVVETSYRSLGLTTSCVRVRETNHRVRGEGPDVVVGGARVRRLRQPRASGLVRRMAGGPSSRRPSTGHADPRRRPRRRRPQRQSRSRSSDVGRDGLHTAVLYPGSLDVFPRSGDDAAIPLGDLPARPVHAARRRLLRVAGHDYSRGSTVRVYGGVGRVPHRTGKFRCARRSASASEIGLWYVVRAWVWSAADGWEGPVFVRTLLDDQI